MPEQNQDNEKLETAKRAKKHLWLTGIIAVFIVAAGVKSGNLVIESVIFHLPCLSAHWTDNFQPKIAR